MKNIILLHGAIGAESQFEALRNLLKENYQIHSFNFYGHGGEIIDQAYRIEKFADQLYAFIEENKIENPIIFGYSMGGMVALDLLSKYELQIEKLITLGTKFGWSPEIALHEIKMLNADVIEAKIPKFAEILKKRHAPEDWKKVLEFTAEMMVHLGANQPINKSTWSEINTPVSVCLADQDEMVSQKETEEVYKLLPNTSFHSISKSRHPIEQVNLEELVRVISGKW